MSLATTARSHQTSHHILEDIKRLRSLRPGWMEDGSGKVPSPSGLDWFEHSEGMRLAGIAESSASPKEEGVPSASVFASPEGHIEIEWWGKDRVFTLTIDADSHTGHWHRTHLAQKTYQSGDANLTEHKGWETVETELLRTF